MPISFEPMRNFMKETKVSYYYLANQGIDTTTLQRIRHDKPITTTTLEKLCKIFNCQPEQLIKYIKDTETDSKLESSYATKSLQFSLSRDTISFAVT